MSNDNGESKKVRGLYKRGETWWMQFAGPNGKVRESTGTSSKKLAISILAKRRVEVAEGRFLDKKREHKSTLGYLVKQYLNRPNCGLRDKFTQRPIIAYFGADVRFGALDAKSIMDYQQFRLTQTRRQGDGLVSQSTVNRERAFISALANWAIKAGLADNNPVRGVQRFPEHNRTRILRGSEVGHLLEACKAGPDYLFPLVFLALTTGARRGSLLALRWDDLDLDRGIMTLRQTKSGREHHIPLPPQTIDVLRTVPHSGCDHVFISKNGKPIKDIRTAFQNACHKAEIVDFSFHCLRHSFGSMLAENGIDAITIKTLLGHRTLDMSLVYTHISDARLKNALDTLPDLLASDEDGEESCVSKKGHNKGTMQALAK